MIDRFQSRIKKPLIRKKLTAKSFVKKYAVNLSIKKPLIRKKLTAKSFVKKYAVNLIDDKSVFYYSI